MTIVLHDSFLNAAQADLQSDKVLVKEQGLFSQTLQFGTILRKGQQGIIFILCCNTREIIWRGSV